MKAYKYIEDSKKVLETLSFEFSKMDNSKTRLEDLNTIIKMLNCFESMLNEKYYTDFMELLILSRLYQTLLKADFSEVNVTEFIQYFDQDLRFGKEYYKEQICELLADKQRYNSLTRGKLYQDKKETWLKSVNNLVKQVKTRILWTKKYK